MWNSRAVLGLLAAAYVAGPASPARAADERAGADVRAGLERCVAAEKETFLSYEAAGLTREAGEARKRLRHLQETLDDLVLGFRGLLPERRTERERMDEEQRARSSANSASCPPGDAAEWFARHQQPDGRWDGGDDVADVETTALALLALLGLGHTHRSRELGPVVRSGFGFLAQSQDAGGYFGGTGGERLAFRQAVATLALCEGFRFTLSPAFRRPAERALAACRRLRVNGEAWGRGLPTGTIDPAATVWMLLALRTGQRARLAVDVEAQVAGLRALDRVSDPATGAVRGTTVEDSPIPCASTRSLTTAAAVARLLNGASFRDPRIERAVARTLEVTPGDRDPFDDWLGTILIWQSGLGSGGWHARVEEVLKGIRQAQRRDPADPERGSFDPTAGRTRATETAVRTLTLAIDYRFRRAFGGEL